MAGRTYCSKELRDGWLQAGNVWLDVERSSDVTGYELIMAGYDLRMDGCTYKGARRWLVVS
jgi:hypothetical protein